MHAAEFGAAAKLREDLARIEQVVRVEGAFHPHLLVEVDLGELLAHQVALLDADPVLAGQYAADANTETQDIGAEFLGTTKLAGIVGVEQDHYSVGTMIEVPRGALTADEIAHTAEFFSFGTNDLTQTCLGMSRDDSGSFLPGYAESEIVKKNPFATVDQTGVGELMRIAIAKGQTTRPGIKLGICGEHGGEPDSVKFCHRLGLTYVSCSPFRVPVARLAAAQAAIEEKRKAAAKPAKKK